MKLKELFYCCWLLVIKYNILQNIKKKKKKKRRMRILGARIFF